MNSWLSRSILTSVRSPGLALASRSAASASTTMRRPLRVGCGHAAAWQQSRQSYFTDGLFSRLKERLTGGGKKEEPTPTPSADDAATTNKAAAGSEAAAGKDATKKDVAALTETQRKVQQMNLTELGEAVAKRGEGKPNSAENQLLDALATGQYTMEELLVQLKHTLDGGLGKMTLDAETKKSLELEIRFLEHMSPTQRVCLFHFRFQKMI